MASNVLYLMVAFSLLLATVTAVDFDYTKHDLETVLAFAEEGNNMQLDGSRVKRGGGNRVMRCTHHENGAVCVCDRRYRNNYNKFYLLCVGVGTGNI